MIPGTRQRNSVTGLFTVPTPTDLTACDPRLSQTDRVLRPERISHDRLRVFLEVGKYSIQRRVTCEPGRANCIREQPDSH